MSKGWNTLRTRYPAPWHLPWRAGGFYSCPYGVASAPGGLNTSTVHCHMFYVPNPDGVTVTSLGVELTTPGSAGTLGRSAIYELADNNDLPGRLLLDSGSFAVDVPAGFVGATGLSKFIPQGWYYAAFSATGGSFRLLNAFLPKYGFGSPSPVDTAAYGWMRYVLSALAITNIVTNGFPNYLPVDFATYVVGSNIPKVIIGV